VKMARTASAKKKLPLPSLGGSVAHKPLWLPASSSVCSRLTLFSESSESSLYGAPALYCYTCIVYKKKYKKNLTSRNLSVDSGTKKYVIF
jgi:hypothetical protein